MIPIEARNEILQRLNNAEIEHDVKILWAIESGSRAWGFASPDSDFDARFIYVHKPEWYLSVGLEEKRDVIEYPIVDEMDINGWDLRKALRLLWKSNPSVTEWLLSPIVYQTHTSFREEAVRILPQIYALHAGIYHYRNMASATYRSHLQGENVSLKKYFYALRPLLSVRWIERFATPAPIVFEALLVLVEDQRLYGAILDLLTLKRETPELGLAPRIDVIHQFIETELMRLEAIKPEVMRPSVHLAILDDLFLSTLHAAWL